MNDTHFYALISRMKYIGRWSLMRNSVPENIQEHSHMVAVLAHALGVIRRDVLGQDCDPEYLAAMALFHDASEILTGDMPTPIKYQNEEIMQAYKAVEDLAAEKLLAMLPEAMRPAYAELLTEDHAGDEYRLVKAADKLSALIKCMEEVESGNREFTAALAQQKADLAAMHSPEADYFLEHMLPCYTQNLDELTKK